MTIIDGIFSFFKFKTKSVNKGIIGNATAITTPYMQNPAYLLTFMSKYDFDYQRVSLK